jgi:hypothetical protein
MLINDCGPGRFPVAVRREQGIGISQDADDDSGTVFHWLKLSMSQRQEVA